MLKRNDHVDLQLLKARLMGLASSGANHAYAGSLCGFYLFVMAQSACISHPEWDSRDAEDLADFLRQRKINLLVDSFGHYENMWNMDQRVNINCLYASLDSVVGHLDSLAEYLELYRKQQAEDGVSHSKDGAGQSSPDFGGQSERSVPFRP